MKRGKDRRRSSRLFVTAFVLLAVSRCGLAQERIRFATYHASLSGSAEGEIVQRLTDGNDEQAERIAAIVQSVRPDVLLVCGIDHDSKGQAAALLAEKYFAVAQGDRYPIVYPYVLAIEGNQGIDSGLDLDSNGQLGEPADAWGPGDFPGQSGMAVFSRYRIERDDVRTFRKFPWSSLPGARLATTSGSNESGENNEVLKRRRLSSRNHLDIPIMVDARPIHLLVSSPIQPDLSHPDATDSCRNQDELRFWVEYLRGDDTEENAFIVDDADNPGGLDAEALVVLLGSLGQTPSKGTDSGAAIDRLLGHPRLQDPMPRRSHGRTASTADPADEDRATVQLPAGRLRVDYILPDHRASIEEAGVFWPRENDVDHELLSASHHRLVWVDVAIP